MTRGARTRGLLLVGLLLALVLAGGGSYYASSSPDGLERVAEDEGFVDSAEDSGLADSPVADYSVRGLEDERLSGGLAGVLGVVATLAVGGLLFRMVRGPRRRGTGAAPYPGSGPEPGADRAAGASGDPGANPESAARR